MSQCFLFTKEGFSCSLYTKKYIVCDISLNPAKSLDCYSSDRCINSHGPCHASWSSGRRGSQLKSDQSLEYDFPKSDYHGNSNAADTKNKVSSQIISQLSLSWSWISKGKQEKRDLSDLITLMDTTFLCHLYWNYHDIQIWSSQHENPSYN